ncbi:Nudix hydrolase YfcD [Bacillus sp. JCM 19046]|uniref:Isopentenyldiphosphate isomerase n=1 Tax=Shouchella xiaoxiensis TaxID=766895 RepID=A0ABS2SP47_9BACI|nr:NUDIX domain-containing protein [Shouchella xiaoxiensis]MBM7837307.1 isopentenyldiphosphate isomerase [Shouchella xiaoxiensis]GAF11497.1 Nudix hydrolase YfcD [Bacillus sp. JCM 19045]GAF16960.1 Nudix hydrolase YfcD [Bacillus sp. JCM 19046]
METEFFKIFDENKNEIGTASREEVHRLGYWHETFHCWLVEKSPKKTYLYLQLRSDSKKDYPSLLDITAAGHILADETPADGVREVKEEIGIDVTLNELISLGLIAYDVTHGALIDRELAHTYLYINEFSFDSFTLQEEEVAGMVKVEWEDFVQLWKNEQLDIPASGFKLNAAGLKEEWKTSVTKEQFVPHPTAFYHTVIQRIQQQL